MKKIIEIGKIFKARCPKCNCLFQYEKEDIQIKKLGGDEYSIITCPQCDVGDVNEEISNRDAAEAFAKVYAKLNSVQETNGVKIEATITTDGINIESSKDNLVYRIIIPKRELDASVDITIPIENTLETAIKKLID